MATDMARTSCARNWSAVVRGIIQHDDAARALDG